MPVKKENRLLFGEDMDIRLRLTFLGHPVCPESRKPLVSRLLSVQTTNTYLLTFLSFNNIVATVKLNIAQSVYLSCIRMFVTNSFA